MAVGSTPTGTKTIDQSPGSRGETVPSPEPPACLAAGVPESICTRRVAGQLTSCSRIQKSAFQENRSLSAALVVLGLLELIRAVALNWSGSGIAPPVALFVYSMNRAG